MKKQMPGVDSRQEREVFGRNFRHARIQLRLRQRDVHIITGIAQSHISEIEAGTCNVAVDTIVKLATVVKTPVWRLFKPADARDDDLPAEDETGRGPRSKSWHDENLSRITFDFTATEMKCLRKAAAKAGMTVVDFVRKVLGDAGVWPSS